VAKILVKLGSSEFRQGIMTPPYHVSPRAEYATPVRTLVDHLVPERTGVGAWWANVKREGEWIVPRALRSFTFMGNLELDLTYAHIGEGTSEMEIRCVLGNVTINVPPDIRVLCDGDSFAGSFDVERVGNTTPPSDAPTVRISGAAYFGNVTIKVVDPNAPGFLARLKAGWTSLTE
jgi:hypothetical protein